MSSEIDISEQQEELQVLRSIFDESVLTIDNKDVPCGTIQINPILPDSFFLVSQSAPESEEEIGGKVKLDFLPPMTLYFQFVQSYPATSCPAFLLTCQWLTFEQLRKLCQQLDFIWKECKPEVVLYRWIRFLQEDALQFLGIDETLDISPLTSYPSGPIEIQFPPAQKRKELSVRPKIPKQAINVGVDVAAANLNQSEKPPRKSARRPTTFSCYKATRSQRESADEGANVTTYYPQIENSHEDLNRDSRAVFVPTDSEELESRLIKFNECRKQMEFEKAWYTCLVCYADKQGQDGMRFHGCDHLFCKECLRSYFTLQIQEGFGQGLTCLADKCKSQALPHQVRELVGNELFSKYDKILLDSTLSQMTDVTVCPFQSCQCSIVIDRDSKLATCPACSYTFCIFCRMTYHGIVPCRLFEYEVEAVVDRYLQANPQEKKEIELKYGRKEIRFLANERLSNNWVKNNSKKCPNCFISIQKTDGCNKMLCLRCDTDFCWLCRAKLSAETPYNHFQDPAIPCYLE